MSKHPLAATATLLVLATSSFLTSCTTSKIMVQTNPADAMIWIDGRQTVRSTAGAAIQARPSYAAEIAQRDEILIQGLRDLIEAKASSPTLREALEGR